MVIVDRHLKLHPLTSKDFTTNIFEISGGSKISPGGRQLPSGRQHTILPNLPENFMKWKGFGRPGGAPLAPPLNPPLDMEKKQKV